MPLDTTHQFDEAARQGVEAFAPTPTEGAWAKIAARLPPPPAAAPPASPTGTSTLVSYGVGAIVLLLLFAVGISWYSAGEQESHAEQTVAQEAHLAYTAQKSPADLETTPDLASTPNATSAPQAEAQRFAPTVTTDSPPAANAAVTTTVTATATSTTPAQKPIPKNASIAAIPTNLAKQLAVVVPANASAQTTLQGSTSNAAGSPLTTGTPQNGNQTSVLPPYRAPVLNEALDKLPSLDATELALSDIAKLGPGPIPCEDFRDRADWQIAVRAFTGAGGTQRTFQSGSSNDLGLYRQLRDSVEERQVNFSTGLRAEGVHAGWLLVRAGIDHQLYRSRMRLLGMRTSTFTLTEVRDPISGDVVRVDTINIVTRTESIFYNRQQTLALTGGLGVHHSFGAVSAYAIGEVGYEFLLHTRGKAVAPDNLLVNLASTDNQWIESRPGLQLGGTVGIDVAITEQLELGVSAHYKQLGGLSGSADPLSADYTTMFGALNARWKF